MIPEEIREPLLFILTRNEGEQARIVSTTGVSGGCINNGAQVTTSRGQYFVKWNNARLYPGMFDAEARGLKLLGSTSTVKVPQVIGSGGGGKFDFLVLEFIPGGREGKDFWRSFGMDLASMHQCHGDSFGLDHDNYIGSLPQSNTQMDSWTEFFIHQRLEPQARMAREAKKAGRELTDALERLYPHLDDFFPKEPPALLHGDLWSGNYMCDAEGKAVIIDPAVYYGHRYMDLGMSKLFGGFSGEFYNHYNEQYPLEESWEKGIEIANLYPLLVHVNLFGGGYLSGVMGVLGRFV